jgi:putative flippase GtrA
MQTNGSIKRNTEKVFLSKEFIVFVFCGGMGTLTNFCVSSLLSMWIPPILAYGIGYAASLFIAYALTARLVFSQKIRFRAFLKFVVSYIPNFAILFTFVSLFIGVLKWYPILVYALAGALGLPITYVIVKIFAFGRHS